MPPYSFTDAATVSGGNNFCSSCNSFTAVLQYPRESEVFFYDKSAFFVPWQYLSQSDG